MPNEPVVEKWPGVISELKLGATKAEGGSRDFSLSIGAEQALPFLFKEGKLPCKPVIAFEIWDRTPADWPAALNSAYANSLDDPFAWAKKCVTEYKAELLCIRLQASSPDDLNRSPDEEANFIRQMLKTVKVPLIITGCGNDEKDNLVLPACSEAAKNERCLIGMATQDNYKTITAAALADGHSIIAESPIDINIAKQLNILISDMGLPLERIAINPTIGALGYGLEYAYSIMERARLAGLAGDKSLACPFICLVGQETWKAKEAKAALDEFPEWGPEMERGIAWELVTALSLIQAGADILVMRHPAAIAEAKKYIEALYENR